MNPRLPKPSPAMVVACIALFVALGGASYAAIKLPRNSVGTPQLKKNAVTSPKVKDRSLRALDFAIGQLPAGPQGPQGPQGPPGPTAAGVSETFPPPPFSGSSLIKEMTITTTAPGKLFVSADMGENAGGGRASTNCGAGACSITFGIYVDGTPVPGAVNDLTGGPGVVDAPVVLLRGLLANVAPGVHTVQLRYTLGGSATGFSAPTPQVQAIAIG